MEKLLKILFLDDTPSDVDLMKNELKKVNLNYISKWVETKEDFFTEIKEFVPDIILCDYSLPSFTGMEAFRSFKEQKLQIPFILVTGNLSEQLALDCLNEGVDDFILKSSFRRVPKAIERAIEKKNVEKEKERISTELLNSQSQLRALLKKIQIVREEERAHIAREIHDELGQQLAALKMDIDWIMYKQNNPEEAVVSKLNEMLKFSDEMINTIRRISTDLRPAIIDNLGLIATLEWKCNEFEEKMRIPCQFTSTVKERKFEDHLGMNIYRILQETLTNISKHAQAKSVTVSVSENETELIMEITDDGKGVTIGRIHNGKTLGIVGMKERAGLMGGELIIAGEKNKGTQIKLKLPFKNEYTNS
jgi:two-component system sensor histidine kinase UhpB